MNKYIFLIMVSAISLYSQDFQESYLFQSLNTARAGIFYQSVKIGEENVNQFAVPISIIIPAGKNLTVSIANNPAFSKNNGSDISGLTETKIGLRYYTLNEKLMIKCIAGLPSGVTKYSAGQFNLAKILSASALDYYVSYYGRGFNANIGVSYAEKLGKTFVLGGGISYYYKGSYYPLDLASGGEYDPGDEITLNLGFDYSFDRRTRLNFDIIYSNYQKDKIDAIDKFQAADRISLFAGFQFRIDKSSHDIYIHNKLKGDNKLYIQDKEFTASNGNQLDIGYSGQFPLNTGLSLLLNLEERLYGDIQQMVVGDLFETGKTSIFGADLGVRVYLSDMLKLDITGKYKTGNINIIKGNIITENSVSGFGAMAMLSVRF